LVLAPLLPQAAEGKSERKPQRPQLAQRISLDGLFTSAPTKSESLDPDIRECLGEKTRREKQANEPVPELPLQEDHFAGGAFHGHTSWQGCFGPVDSWQGCFWPFCH
jgi:hypothetical protein